VTILQVLVMSFKIMDYTLGSLYHRYLPWEKNTAGGQISHYRPTTVYSTFLLTPVTRVAMGREILIRNWLHPCNVILSPIFRDRMKWSCDGSLTNLLFFCLRLQVC
jgi:hypothetical protein